MLLVQRTYTPNTPDVPQTAAEALLEVMQGRQAMSADQVLPPERPDPVDSR